MWRRGLAPHILFLFHSLPLPPPKPGEQRTERVRCGRWESLGTGVGQRPNSRSSHHPMLAWALLVPLRPPTERTEDGWCFPKAMRTMTLVRRVEGDGPGLFLTCPHLSPRPAARSPRPPSGG